MMAISSLFGALVVIACVSPLLTFLHLWQMKEWRWDRLMDHLKTEGFLASLLSEVRIVIGAIWILAFVVIAMLATLSLISVNETFDALWPSVLAGTLCGVSAIQWISKKQPLPVWTRKAQLMFSVSLFATVAVVILSTTYTSVGHNKTGDIFETHPFELAVFLLPYLQWLFAMIAWVILYPIDQSLKKTIINRARSTRAKHPNLTVIGITGSVGKTTTKELLAHILKKQGAMATPVHVNTEMGVAGWLTKVLKDKPADWAGILIVEMGAYRKGEIKLLSDIAKPKLGIITFIGEQHLALFGSLEAIRNAKGELFEALPEGGHAFLNHDNVASEKLRDLCRCPVSTVGTDGRADVCAFDIEETGNGIRFTVSGQRFHVPIAGTHLVTSVLFAIAASQKLGMTLPVIAKELGTFAPLARSFQVKTIRGVTVLDDTYNSSPDSFRAAIRWAKEQPHPEKVLLIDGIIELGASEASVHAELSREAATIFGRVCIGNARFLKYFKENGFGSRAVLLSSKPEPLKTGDLLVCVGRVPRTAIDELLPVSAEDMNLPLRT